MIESAAPKSSSALAETTTKSGTRAAGNEAKKAFAAGVRAGAHIAVPAHVASAAHVFEAAPSNHAELRARIEKKGELAPIPELKPVVKKLEAVITSDVMNDSTSSPDPATTS